MWQQLDEPVKALEFKGGIAPYTQTHHKLPDGGNQEWCNKGQGVRGGCTHRACGFVGYMGKTAK